MKTLLFLLLACLSTPLLLLAQDEQRTALVMGVWEYEGTGSGEIVFPSLPGIESDVKKMAERLRSLRFDVTTVTNPTLTEAREAIDQFGKKLSQRKGTGLFYFSGHGCEQEGKNFLIPRHAAISSKRDLPSEAVFADRVLARMEEGGAVNLVFLDCCRNGLTKGVGGGLAPMEARGVFIGFATASDRAANASSDGSPYTAALIKYLGEPGVSITDTHTKVQGEVARITAELGSPQRPFQYSGLSDVYYLAPPGSVGLKVGEDPPPTEPKPVTPPGAVNPGSPFWVFAESSQRRLRREELAALDKETAWRARNEIYARHGYKFASEKGQALARALAGEYRPMTADQDAIYLSLNSYERANIDLLKEIENTGSVSLEGSQNRPPPVADSIWVFPDSSSRYLSRKEAAGLSGDIAWRARNEIYARHGLVFTSARGKAFARSLGRFYSPVTANVNAIEGAFNACEKANVELLKSLGVK